MSINKLIEKYSHEEIADSFVITSKIKQSKKGLAKNSLNEARNKTQDQISDRARLTLLLMQLKFQIEDYLREDAFNAKFTFSYFLKEYVTILKKKRKDFAQEISIDETELSQLINKHRQPNENIIIRLELHSKNSIPAVMRYKLLVKEKIHILQNNSVLRKKERKNVNSFVEVNLA